MFLLSSTFSQLIQLFMVDSDREKQSNFLAPYWLPNFLCALSRTMFFFCLVAASLANQGKLETIQRTSLQPLCCVLCISFGMRTLIWLFKLKLYHGKWTWRKTCTSSWCCKLTWLDLFHSERPEESGVIQCKKKKKTSTMKLLKLFEITFSHF